ncbi:hypothetical protein [Halorubrum lipolyticum]|uniref:hypothetical protein n=1 Tax=Halorubrum lipolyticum TaxID=368624 RepID=UPI0011C76354|nr:hypothetical protein [Halorubrum lipolyticum]
MVSEGILYIATGEKYLDQAKLSAKTVNRHTELPIAVVSHRSVEDEVFDYTIVAEDPEDSFADKPKYITKSPFERTLYFDTDIFLIANITELLEMLDHADVATAIDPYEWEHRVAKHYSFSEVPESVPIFQTGVIAYKDTDQTRELFENWYDIHMDCAIERDQASFRPALYQTDVQYISFSHNYNFPVNWPIHAVGEVKILHSNYIKDLETLKTLSNRINGSSDIRSFYGSGDPSSIQGAGFTISVPTSTIGNAIAQSITVPVKYLIKLKRLGKFTLQSAKEEGIWTTTRKAINSIRAKK